jgi:hypothetical protein
MKSNALSLNASNIVLGVLGIMGALLIFAVFTNRQIPLVSGHRAAFVALLIFGVVMCALGPLRSIQPTAWGQPMTVVAVVLGSLALLLSVAVLSGIRMPLIPNDRAAFVALAIIMVTKVVLTAVHHTWSGR